jgi:NAD(P) transhydrogenase subunit beta
MTQQYILDISYLVASITFILGLKYLGHPDSARKGNLIAAAGMLIAIIATIFLYHNEAGKPISNLIWIFGGILIGGVVGTVMARKVKMTAMPQMVSMFNGLGALCVAIISYVEFSHYGHNHPGSALLNGNVLTILLGLMIGCVSFAGSMVAWGKLEGKISDFSIPGGQVINIILLLAMLGVSGYIMSMSSPNNTFIYILLGISLMYGIFFVFPIGGADMPVVISLLNSFTGIAAACGGFLYSNQVMLTGGILVGSSGTILTILMCKAMNRSLMNVIIGSFAAKNKAVAGEVSDRPPVKEINVSDCAILMSYANKVIIIPGYGLAVAQAQHSCHELEKLLEQKGVPVEYAIHPVAGRMPGHMNVLLAEADVPYPKLREMDDINPEFDNTDVVLVLGANDVINPAAKNDPNSPIYGMPILEAENAKNIIINKRSMRPGYAGIENDLFYSPKTRMLFGDAKEVLQKLISELKTI